MCMHRAPTKVPSGSQGWISAGVGRPVCGTQSRVPTHQPVPLGEQQGWAPHVHPRSILRLAALAPHWGCRCLAGWDAQAGGVSLVGFTDPLCPGVCPREALSQHLSACVCVSVPGYVECARVCGMCQGMCAHNRSWMAVPV